MSNVQIDKTKIYRHEKETKSGSKFVTYSYTINSKKVDNTWVTAYRECRFKKGVEVNNKSVIKVNKAFEIAEEYNGKAYDKLMITDFEVLTDGENNASVTTDSSGFMNIPDSMMDEMPFN